MPDVPSEAVTFLFTDIEGSTTLWERNPAEMGPALARHDTLMRSAIEQHDGTVFKTMGDAFCATFPTAFHAVAAVRAAQLSLTHEPWPPSTRIKVRMALHTATAEVRNNDYFGQPLNRVSRLLAAGHGGQVLLSMAAVEKVRAALPAEVSLRDLGERRLKDLIRPERVFQLVAPGLDAEFPPLRTLDARAHNLPIQSTSFVGREAEMLEVKTLLRSSRIVTLTGSGGAGKTRLALQVGADHIDDFADGVWFAELAPLTDPRLIAQTVATLLGIKEEPGLAITEHIDQRDQGQGTLAAAGQLRTPGRRIGSSSAQTLLARCARVRLLVTSREALRVPGESTYRVPSLPVPDPGATPSIASLTQFAAVQLFVDRVAAVQAGVRPEQCQRRRGRQHLPPTGRNPPGHRTGGGEASFDGVGGCERAAQPAFPFADGRRADGAAAPANAARADRLEL